MSTLISSCVVSRRALSNYHLWLLESTLLPLKATNYTTKCSCSLLYCASLRAQKQGIIIHCCGPDFAASGDYVTIKVSSAVTTLIFLRSLCLSVFSSVWTLHCLMCQFLSHAYLFHVSVFCLSFSFPGGGLKQAVWADYVCHDQLWSQCGDPGSPDTCQLSSFLSLTHTHWSHSLPLPVTFSQLSLSISPSSTFLLSLHS